MLPAVEVRSGEAPLGWVIRLHVKSIQGCEAQVVLVFQCVDDGGFVSSRLLEKEGAGIASPTGRSEIWQRPHLKVITTSSTYRYYL